MQDGLVGVIACWGRRSRLALGKFGFGLGGDLLGRGWRGRRYAQIRGGDGEWGELRVGGKFGLLGGSGGLFLVGGWG